MELEGKIKLVGETQTFGDKGFKKRELVITTNEQYPQDILIEFVQDKCDILNKYAIGQDVKVGINIRGREWINPQGEVRYFNSIQGWKIESSTGAPSPSDSKDFAKIPDNSLNEDTDDLPF